jgi:hypothetical protein
MAAGLFASGVGGKSADAQVGGGELIYACKWNVFTRTFLLWISNPRNCSAANLVTWNAQGPAGPPGLGVSNVYRRSVSMTLPSLGLAMETAECDPGDVAIGGGFAGLADQNYVVRISNPTETGYTVALDVLSDPPGGFSGVEITAVCLRAEVT